MVGEGKGGQWIGVATEVKKRKEGGRGEGMKGKAKEKERDCWRRMTVEARKRGGGRRE